MRFGRKKPDTPRIPDAIARLDFQSPVPGRELIELVKRAALVWLGEGKLVVDEIGSYEPIVRLIAHGRLDHGEVRFVIVPGSIDLSLDARYNRAMSTYFRTSTRTAYSRVMVLAYSEREDPVLANVHVRHLASIFCDHIQRAHVQSQT